MAVEQNKEARALAEQQAADALLLLSQPVRAAADITIALPALKLVDPLIPQSATFDAVSLADALAAAIGGGASTVVTVDSAAADTTGAVRVRATVTAARAVFVTPGQDPADVVDFAETATVGTDGPATTLQSAVLRAVAAAIGATATRNPGSAQAAAGTVNAKKYVEVDLFVDTVRPQKDLDIMTDVTNKCVGLILLAPSLERPSLLSPPSSPLPPLPSLLSPPPDEGAAPSLPLARLSTPSLIFRKVAPGVLLSSHVTTRPVAAGLSWKCTQPHAHQYPHLPFSLAPSHMCQMLNFSAGCFVPSPLPLSPHLPLGSLAPAGRSSPRRLPPL